MLQDSKQRKVQSAETVRNCAPGTILLSLLSGKKRAHWDIRRNKQGSTGRCPRDFLLSTIENGQKRAFLPGHLPGVPRNTRPSRGFQQFYMIFCSLYCLGAPIPKFETLLYLFRMSRAAGISARFGLQTQTYICPCRPPPPK